MAIVYGSNYQLAKSWKCPMSFWNNRKRYYQLLQKFVDGNIGGTEFEARFATFWREDRDNKLATTKFEASLRDCVMNMFQKNTLQNSKQFANVLSRIFTACDVFDPDPTTRTEYEYDEDDLRNFVRSIIAENEALFRQG